MHAICGANTPAHGLFRAASRVTAIRGFAVCSAVVAGKLGVDDSDDKFETAFQKIVSQKLKAPSDE
jgi:hypothetical protein